MGLPRGGPVHRILAGAALVLGSALVVGSAVLSPVPAGESGPARSYSAEPVDPGPDSADGGTVPEVPEPGQPDGTLPELGPLPPLAAPAPPGAAVAGIPAVALAAYRSAAARLAGEQPGCRLPMPLLAAIGRVESGHARGGAVDAAGTAVPVILGPVLDGRGALAAIADTDGGRYDGDTRWDRAAGPMQFIPGTWQRWAADGNADNRADPQNLPDATVAAGRYLCAGGRDLGTDPGLDAAVLSYNRSPAYLRLVRMWMLTYRSAVPGPDRQAGTTPVEQTPAPPAVLAAPDPAAGPSASATPARRNETTTPRPAPAPSASPEPSASQTPLVPLPGSPVTPVTCPPAPSGLAGLLATLLDPTGDCAARW